MKAILTNGINTRLVYKSTKGFDIWDPDDTPEAWTGIQKANAVSLVPAVQSAWQARCKAIADLPFTIYSSRGVEIDNSDDYKNAVGFIPNPRRFMWLTEAALVGYGQAYWLRKQNKYLVVKELQYFIPSSITCKLESVAGLVGFTRNHGAGTTRYKPEDLFYVWLPDPSVEIGPPSVWPLASALLSADALDRINAFVASYMKRGAVKAMLLAAHGMPGQGEAERVENWFNQFMRGVNNLRWKMFNADKITPTIVGEGLDAFKGITIVDDLIRQVHTAMGTRHMLEDENYATADVRQREFYSNTIVPEARLIGDALNEQILDGMGYRIEFNPEKLEVFGDDEAANMTAFSTVSQSMSQSTPEVIELSLSLAGVVLTEDQQKMLDTIKKMQKPATVAETDTMDDMPASGDMGSDMNPAADDMAKWLRKALKRVGKDVSFLSESIPDAEQARIHAALPGCVTEADVKAVFEIQNINSPVVQEFEKIIQPDYAPLLEAMRLEVQAFKLQQQLQPVTINNYLPEAKPVVNMAAQEPVSVTVNVPEQPAPVVNVTSEVKADRPDESNDVVKAIRKLAREK